MLIAAIAVSILLTCCAGLYGGMLLEIRYSRRVEAENDDLRDELESERIGRARAEGMLASLGGRRVA
jgi:hypothetical protein